jgi:hypothetical protein
MFGIKTVYTKLCQMIKSLTIVNDFGVIYDSEIKSNNQEELRLSVIELLEALATAQEKLEYRSDTAHSLP